MIFSNFIYLASLLLLLSFNLLSSPG